VIQVCIWLPRPGSRTLPPQSHEGVAFTTCLPRGIALASAQCGGLLTQSWTPSSPKTAILGLGANLPRNLSNIRVFPRCHSCATARSSLNAYLSFMSTSLPQIPTYTSCLSVVVRHYYCHPLLSSEKLVYLRPYIFLISSLSLKPHFFKTNLLFLLHLRYLQKSLFSFFFLRPGSSPP
jgi:hypothetical protein